MKNSALPIRLPFRHVDVVAPHVEAVDYGIQVPTAAIASILLTLIMAIFILCYRVDKAWAPFLLRNLIGILAGQKVLPSSSETQIYHPFTTGQ